MLIFDEPRTSPPVALPLLRLLLKHEPVALMTLRLPLVGRPALQLAGSAPAVYQVAVRRPNSRNIGEAVHAGEQAAVSQIQSRLGHGENLSNGVLPLARPSGLLDLVIGLTWESRAARRMPVDEAHRSLEALADAVGVDATLGEEVDF